MDLTNPSPAGGPLNFPLEGHNQNYLPQPGKGYKDTLEFERIKGESKSEKSLTLTGLDLESTEAGIKQQEYREPWINGGPNRKNLLKSTDSDTYNTQNSTVGETNYLGEDPNLKIEKQTRIIRPNYTNSYLPPEGASEEGETYINSLNDRGNNI